ncbi:MAG: hypothetical protein J0I09_14855 [Sphingobacteriia bacterium]|nr:hypothetical protein [Sphingobacteriia bacterium]
MYQEEENAMFKIGIEESNYIKYVDERKKKPNQDYMLLFLQKQTQRIACSDYDNKDN